MQAPDDSGTTPMHEHEHSLNPSSTTSVPNDDRKDVLSPETFNEKEAQGRPLSIATTITNDASDAELQPQDGATPLGWEFTPVRMKWAIIMLLLFFIETGVLPLILFYSLRWGAHLSITTNLAIITSVVGTFSGCKLAHRTYLLWFKNGHESRRPIGAGRWGMDFFNILLNFALAAFFIPLIIGSSL